jgi:hypothetical protein
MPPNPQEIQYLAREIVAWCLILLGAFFLAKSIVVKGQKWTMKELLGLRVDKLKVFRNLIIQRLEAGFGFLFVLAGVSIHLYILLRKYEDRHVGAAYQHLAVWLGGTILAMVVLAILFHFVTKYVSRKSFLEILAYLVVRYRYRIEDDQELLKQIGELVEVERREDDSVETYAARVEERLRLDRVRGRLARKNKPVELR